MKQPLERITVDTIVGTLIIAGDATHIHTVKFGGATAAGETSHGKVSSAALGMARAQLKEYFSGSRRRFDLPLLPVGTDFQKRVWRALAGIDYGAVLTYGELARSLGTVHLARAVGQAANRNPLPIIIPCHRLVGSNGWIGGFAPGVALKKILLEHENGAGGR